MTFNVLNRQVHYWTSIIVALPLGVRVLAHRYAVALLWIGGLWMWWVPFAAKRRRRR